jgi:hypothetical protein
MHLGARVMECCVRDFGRQKDRKELSISFIVLCESYPEVQRSPRNYLDTVALLVYSVQKCT